MTRQTLKDRQRIKTELSQAFDQWNKMTDDELLAEVKKRFPIVTGPPNRGQCLKFLTMDKVDQIN